jgi:uncharacterized protein YbjT (DUF2867 family)
MDATRTHVVTGGLGYSGRYIARRLIAAGHRSATLTNSGLSRPNPFGDGLEVRPLRFDDPAALAESLRGAQVLVNTYWVRFNHRASRGGFTHSAAVENTLKLFEAAKKAGVRRVVHVSITNPSEGSPLEYFRGKAVLEKALRGSGLSYAILRPAVLFGDEDILVNNIAWMLRRFPVLGLFGDGRYRLQPIFVDDLAALAVEQADRTEDAVIEAIGPETFTYRELARELGRAIGKERPMVALPPWLGFWFGKILGWLVGDVIVTREEIEGLMADLLYVNAPAPALASTRLSAWAREHAATLGARYASELGRRT